jgi:signal transduction histidine kinase
LAITLTPDAADVTSMSQLSERAPRRSLASASVSLLGLVLLAIPVYDMLDDVTDLSWGIGFTLAENASFLLLASVLVYGGLWLRRVDWETQYVTTVAVHTILGTAAIAALIGWAVVMQLVVMDALKPFVLALNGVLVGAVISFGFALSTARSEIRGHDLEREQSLTRKLTALHEYASELEAATATSEAYDIVGDAVEEFLDAPGFKLTIDGEVVEARGADVDADAGGTRVTESVPVGDRGELTVLESHSEYEQTVSRLLSTHLDRTLQRLERESALRDERDRFEFLNQTVRHELLNDINLVQSQLERIERGSGSVEEYLGVITARVEKMAKAVTRMRAYTKSVLEDGTDLEPVSLRPALVQEVDALHRTYPDAAVELGEIPEVAVRADDLLGAVFENLLTNAVEHNDAETPRVEVDATVDEGVVRVTVADNGPGVPADRRDEIFDRGEHGTRSSGRGFGLYLVDGILDEYGGAVDVRDNEPSGAEFVVVLPLAEE